MALDALSPPSGTITVADLQISSRRRRRDAVMKWLFFSAAMVSVFVSIAIIWTLAAEAYGFVANLSQEEGLGALWTDGWFPRRGMYDLATLLIGSALVTGVAMVVALPLGLGAAVYLSEYASPRTRRTLKPIIEVLAGIPSVVLGYFALRVIAPDFVQRIWTDAAPFNLLSAGIAVGILTIPLMASVSEDAIRSVPAALREASAGLGAKKKTTTLKVVLPAAISGLVAASILSISRALGETMVVAMAAGAVGGSLRSWELTEPGQTMTAAMASLATGTDQVRGASSAFPSLFFVGALLFVLTLSLNLIAGRLVRRFRKGY